MYHVLFKPIEAVRVCIFLSQETVTVMCIVLTSVYFLNLGLVYVSLDTGCVVVLSITISS